MRAKRNFSRFYAIARSQGIDLSQSKEALVLEFTDGRTSSLREMSDAEYNEMCDCLQYGHRTASEPREDAERRRKARSAVLHRLQLLGVDTTDFAKVDAFCENPKIAGKAFRKITIPELEALIPKLEAICRKPRKQPEAEQPKPEQPPVPDVYRFMMHFYQNANRAYS